MSKYSKEYYQKNKKSQAKSVYKMLRLPWYRTYYAIYNRLGRAKRGRKKDACYLGVEMKLSIADLRELWFRDRGEDMEKASIDRINSKGDYVFENCRYIELSLNCSRRYHI